MQPSFCEYSLELQFDRKPKTSGSFIFLKKVMRNYQKSAICANSVIVMFSYPSILCNFVLICCIYDILLTTIAWSYATVMRSTWKRLNFIQNNIRGLSCTFGGLFLPLHCNTPLSLPFSILRGLCFYVFTPNNIFSKRYAKLPKIRHSRKFYNLFVVLSVNIGIILLDFWVNSVFIVI